VIPLKDNIPTRRFPILTVALIAANVLVFFFFQEATLSLSGASVNEQRVVEYGAIPYEITHPGEQCIVRGTQAACGESEVIDRRTAVETAPTVLTAFTSMFMHGGLLHLLFNMLFLWIFGNNVEDSMGRPRFIVFYLLGGLAALAAQTLLEPSSVVPIVGASGAIAAVLGGYALLYPRARVITLVIIIFFITVIELPALLVLGLWFILQLIPAVGELGQPVGGGGVAYFAHIGGFVFGLLLIRVFANRVHKDYEIERRVPVY
jgi:membrane associated rhomboid family serine protease